MLCMFVFFREVPSFCETLEASQAKRCFLTVKNLNHSNEKYKNYSQCTKYSDTKIVL
jgi:hypothetical protein